MIGTGLAIETVGAVIAALTIAAAWHWGPPALFLPQLLVAFGNGLLMPNTIAGAVSVRPLAAGAASGIMGYTQMAMGAALAQLVTLVLADAVTAMPMLLMIVAESVLATVIFVALARRQAAERL